MPSSAVSVLLVDDSLIALTILSRMLSTSPDIQVVGKARNGREALELIPRLQPAVICTDLHMPDMDGLELTKEIMARFPRPILVVSAAVHPEDSHNVFQLLEAGAIDVLPKPRGGLAETENGAWPGAHSRRSVVSIPATHRRYRRVNWRSTGPADHSDATSGRFSGTSFLRAAYQ